MVGLSIINNKVRMPTQCPIRIRMHIHTIHFRLLRGYYIFGLKNMFMQKKFKSFKNYFINIIPIIKEYT